MTILTGHTNGTYYDISSELKQHCKEEFKPYGGLKIISTDGSCYNFRKMLQTDVPFGWIQEDVLKVGQEEPNIDKLQELFFSWDGVHIWEEIHIIIRKDANLSSLEDLNNKKVAIGEKASGSHITARYIRKLLGIEWQDKLLDVKNGIESLRRGEVDAVICVVGQPFLFLKKLKYKNLTLLSFENSKLEKDIYKKHIISKNSYPMLDRDIHTYAVKAHLIAQKKLSIEIIKAMKSCIAKKRKIFNESSKKNPLQTPKYQYLVKKTQKNVSTELILY